MEGIIQTITQLVNQVGGYKLVIGAVIVLVLIIAYFVYRSMRLKHYRKKIVEVENRMNAIKSLPLQYRLGRVQSISKNMPDVFALYEEYSKEYERICDFQKNELSILGNEVDEQLFYGKLNKVSKKMKVLNQMLDQYENDSKSLLKKVEKVTEIENIQRVQIIKVKEKYRKLIDVFESMRLKVEDYVPNLLDIFNELDESFVTLENYMNTQKFEEANEFTKEINDKIEWTSANIVDLPSYIAVVRQFIPKKIEKINSLIEEMPEEHYSLDQLNVNERLTHINEELDVMVKKVKEIELSYLSENVENFVIEIDTLIKDLETEINAFNEFKTKWNDCYDGISTLYKDYKEALIDYNKIKGLYFLDELDITIEDNYSDFEDILKESYELEEQMKQGDFSYTLMNEQVDSLKNRSVVHSTYIQEFITVRDHLYLQEQRAINELENINIVLLEIKSEIKNKHLPMINESYKDYIQDSYDKAAEIQAYRQNRPVELSVLSKKVDGARDVIYKLYDNVHNLIVTAEMVEEAIVYGNRYRSTFLEVNTELTKAEVLFRNGEYTKALSTAVDIIEKIKPGSYEELIRKSMKKSD